MFFCDDVCAIAEEQAGSGRVRSVQVPDLFGWTTFVVTGASTTLAIADTEAGAFITALTRRMSRYLVLLLGFPLYGVRTIILQHFCAY